MISLWQHIPVVLGLLALHIASVIYFMGRVRDLQAALLAKKVLLGGDEVRTLIAQAAGKAKPQTQPLLAGETLTLQGPGGDWYVEITSKDRTTLEVRSVQVA